MTTSRALITAILVLLGCGLVASAVPFVAGEAQLNQGQGRFAFALIGDMPYGPEGDAKFPNVIADINADRQIAFVAHNGDFKNGSSLCSNELFANRLDLFNQFDAPFVFIPGDNEWTDCHRANNGSYDPIERLQYLRALFFPSNQSLGRRPMPLDRQSDYSPFGLYRENTRWMAGQVLFVGLHVVGSNNNVGRTPVADAEYALRNQANMAWLEQSFAIAAAQQARAVMIIFQANPLFELAAADPRRLGFNDTLDALERLTLAYGRPVVLVHGDSHYFRIDKPLFGERSGRRLESFTRVETFGENDNHWLHVSVEPTSPNVFVFDQRIVSANLIAH
jgi:hypothetical protein